VPIHPGVQLIWRDGVAYAAERRAVLNPAPEEPATLVIKLQPESEAVRYGVKSVCGGIGSYRLVVGEKTRNTIRSELGDHAGNPASSSEPKEVNCSPLEPSAFASQISHDPERLKTGSSDDKRARLRPT
jgi:hypothetical protein